MSWKDKDGTNHHSIERGEIRLEPQTRKLDLEGLRRREFTEFSPILEGRDAGAKV